MTESSTAPSIRVQSWEPTQVGVKTGHVQAKHLPLLHKRGVVPLVGLFELSGQGLGTREISTKVPLAKQCKWTARSCLKTSDRDFASEESLCLASGMLSR